MEVILLRDWSAWQANGILHVCGGDPTPSGYVDLTNGYSPRMWRWSYLDINVYEATQVFSTYVEVIPLVTPEGQKHLSILHVCGGDP